MSAVRAQIARLLRTVRHLRPQQVGWRLVHEGRTRFYRHAGALPRVWVRPDAQVRAALAAALDVPICLPEAGAGVASLWRGGHASYHGVQGDRSDWSGQGRTRLWRYERQYHTELLALASKAARTSDSLWLEETRALVDGWWRACPPLAGEAWEPYPVARRVLSWAVAMATCPALGPHLASRLAPQARFLAGHIEWHLLGNHLLCDAAALVSASAVLDGEDMPSIGRRGAAILERELGRQVLPDGGYAERTVTYHAIVLRDVLWAWLLSRARGRPLPVLGAAQAMLSWLSSVVRPDGSFPCLNDAAPDVTPDIADLFRLARLAGLEPSAPFRDGLLTLPDTGWSFVRSGAHELLLDTGPAGPPEQPGHGHADASAYELVWDGSPLVTDTGVSTYERDDTRVFERSAAAHATVSVDGEGADETWASFRIGGRGRQDPVTISPLSGGVWALSAAATSFRGWRHERRMIFWPGRLLVVDDVVTGAPPGARTVSHVPLAPGWSASMEGQGVLLRRDQTSIRLIAGAGCPLSVSESWAASGFSKRVPRPIAHVAAAQGAATYALLADGVIMHGFRGACRAQAAGDEISFSL